MTLDEVDALLEAIEVATGRQDLGFDVGRLISLKSHDHLGLAMIRCETPDQVLRLTVRHFDLITPSFVLEYHRAGDIARIVYRPVASMTSRVLRTLNEIHAVSTHAQLKAMLAEHLPPHDIYLAGAAPRHARRYDNLAQARVHFGSLRLPEVHIVLPALALDLPLPGGDRRSLQLTESRLRKLPSVAGQAGRWSDWVRLILMEAVDSQPTLEKLAGLLNVTPRTLNRHLGHEGQSFRTIANTARFQRACQRLAEGERSVSDIAYGLGYSDVANFSHAFRAMSGMSPRAYRRWRGGGESRSSH
ncbi:MAG: helix-turn-helix domain-containing protein [Acidimicrobiales bacterium]